MDAYLDLGSTPPQGEIFEIIKLPNFRSGNMISVGKASFEMFTGRGGGMPVIRDLVVDTTGSHKCSSAPNGRAY